MKGKLVIISLIGLLLFILPAAKLEAERVNSITIPTQVRVRKMEVKLGNIARISGNKSFVEQVGGITLGRSPLPGYKRVLYRQMIVDALRKQGIDLSKVRFNIPYQFKVTSNYRKIKVANLLQAGKNHIYDTLSYPEEKIEITPVSPPRELRTPHGSLEFKITSSNRNLLGSTMLPVQILVDGQVYKQVYLQYKVKLDSRVLVAKKNLSRGQDLTKDLFEVKTKTVTHNRGKFVQPGAELQGKRLKQPLQAGDILMERVLEVPPLVKRWQDVTIIARINGVEVTTTGRALESGRRGEKIKVKNKNSGKNIKAEVISKGKVQISIK